jgi:hypothetical protein
MWDSQRNNPEATKVTLALATDYFEVLATARSTRLLPGQRCLIALVRKTAAARAGEEYYHDPGNVSVVVFGERRMVSPNASGSNSLDMAAAAHCLYAT